MKITYSTYLLLYPKTSRFDRATSAGTSIAEPEIHQNGIGGSKRMFHKSALMGLVVLLAAGTAQVRADSDHSKVIQGGGTTIVTGGGPGLAPVITKFGFHWRDGEGKFECLALVPSAKAGTPGSGNFDANAMYVTGQIASAEIHGPSAILKGVATVTGLGAGSHLPFTATAEAGGPGARMVLVVSGLTFDEVVIEGAIDF
jgi:hypothetical protein